MSLIAAVRMFVVVNFIDGAVVAVVAVVNSSN